MVAGNGYEGSMGLLASREHPPLDDWGCALVEALDEATELPAFLKDKNRRFLWCSTRLANIAGFDKQQDLLGKRDEDLSPAYLAAQYRLNDERVLQRGERMIGVVEFVDNHQGNCDCYLSTKLPVRSPDGEILGLVGVTRPLSRQSRPGRDAPMMAAALELMSGEFRRRLTITELARSVSMSPSHFNRIFKQQLGVTPHQYLRRVRLMAACDLLASTDLPMSLVAAETGYYDQSHFANDFVREWHLTPSSYRRKFGTAYAVNR